jgi:hypothetical protein
MSDLMHLEDSQDLPLPLIVAHYWNFPLAHHVKGREYWYAIQDWIAGLLSADTRKASKRWDDMQRALGADTSVLVGHMPYVTREGKTYQRDFTNDKGLYLIAQHLRATKGRTLLAEIKEYLAKAGVFVDEIRRDPTHVVASGVLDPEQAIQSAIEEYRRRGKDDNWINARLTGIVSRHRFTTALKIAIKDIVQNHYARATNEVYLGLWSRTADILKTELDLSKKENLRDNQPTLGLMYQGIAEEACARKLGTREELPFQEGLEIIRQISVMIGEQAKITSQYLGMDLATGRALLTD